MRVWPSSLPLGVCRLLTTCLCIASAFFSLSRVEAQSPSVSLMKVPTTGDASRFHSYDAGRAQGSQSMGRMLWVLKRSQAQEDQLQDLLEQQQDQSNPQYHKWLTPESYADQFGPSGDAVNAVTNYLMAHGLSVAKIHRGVSAIEFSGTVSQVQQALHAEIHNYALPSGKHMRGFASTPQIDESVGRFTALVVADPPETVSYIRPRTATYNKPTHKVTIPPYEPPGDPDVLRANSGTYDPNFPFQAVFPGDLGPLYDVPYYGSTGTLKAMDGSGVTIGIVGLSNLNLAYPANYRATFGLPSNTPNVIVDGSDPGITDGDEYADYSQIELVSAVAPNARLNYYVAGGTDQDTGEDFALLRALADNQVQVMLLGFQQCEAFLNSGNNLGINPLLQAIFEEASVQGITVVAASGNTGSGGCDSPAPPATQGLAVNAYASTPYTVSVGGTDFYYGASDTASDATYAQYWNTSPTGYVNSLTYVPEQPWNDANGTVQENPAYYFPYNFASGGGISAVGDVPENLDSNGNLISYGTPGPYPQPAWQKGIVPSSISSTDRVVPDVALFSGDGINNSEFLFCAASQDCSPTGTNQSFTAIGGTQNSAAVFAGIMSLVVQQHGAQGNANPTLYSLFKTKPAVFHAISQGNNTVQCTSGTPNCTNGSLVTTAGGIAYPATGSYSAATGLGSVDAAALVTNWANPNTTATTSTISITNPTTGAPVTTFSHGDTVRVSTIVTGSGGTPSGEVQVIDTSALPSNASEGPITLSRGTGYLDTNDLPGGTYQVRVRYGGDQTFAPSVSAPITITVAGVPSNIVIESQTPQNGQSIAYGSPMSVSLGLYDNKSVATATGYITLKDGSTTIAVLPLDSEGYVSFSSSTFKVGSHNLTASYSGDAGYNPSTLTSGLGFTVTSVGTTTALSQSASGTVASNGATDVTATITPSTAGKGLAPSGTVTIFNGSNTAIAQNIPVTAAVSNGQPIGIATASISGNQLGSGTIAIHAVYTPAAGASYSGSTSGAINVGAGGAAANATTTTIATSDGASTYFDIAFQIVVSGKVTGGITPTGTVSLYSNGSLVASGVALNSGTWTYTIANNTGLLPLPLGPNTLVVEYGGDSTHASSAATLKLSILDDATAGDFTMQPSVVSQIVTSSTPSATFPLGFASLNGFAGTVTLTYAAHAGVSCSFAPSTVTLTSGGIASLNVTCSESGLAAGNYPVSISGTSTFATGLSPNTTATLTHSAQIILSVH